MARIGLERRGAASRIVLDRQQRAHLAAAMVHLGPGDYVGVRQADHAFEEQGRKGQQVGLGLVEANYFLQQDRVGVHDYSFG